jgi:hypothetical protein
MLTAVSKFVMTTSAFDLSAACFSLSRAGPLGQLIKVLEVAVGMMFHLVSIAVALLSVIVGV